MYLEILFVFGNYYMGIIDVARKGWCLFVKNGDICSIEPPATISLGSYWKSKGTDSEYNLQIYVIHNFLFKSIWTYKAYANCW